MSHVDVTTLAPHVQAVLDNPHTSPTTGDAALDTVLTHLAQHRRSQQPLVGAPALALFWTADGPPADARPE